MNYRHAFHAGNVADCVKHALLVWLAEAMQRKPGGFIAVDTHAGTGRTDLAGEAAERTGEWRSGIGRLWPDPPEELRGYVSLALPDGVPGDAAPGPRPYLGSPALLRALLRPQDRLVCCELHPEDHTALRRLFHGDPQVAVHLRDGHEALRAFLPPPERRALVVLDPRSRRRGSSRGWRRPWPGRMRASRAGCWRPGIRSSIARRCGRSTRRSARARCATWWRRSCGCASRRTPRG